VVPQGELTQRFDFYASKLQSNFDFGRLEATQTIAELNSVAARFRRGQTLGGGCRRNAGTTA
jgi:hypothetical protein